MAYSNGLGVIRYNGKEYNVVRINNKFARRLFQENEKDSYSTITLDIPDNVTSTENLFRICSQSSKDIEVYIANQKQELNGTFLISTIAGEEIITIGGENIIIVNFSTYELDPGIVTVKISGDFKITDTKVSISGISLCNNLLNCSRTFEGCTGLYEAPVIPSNVYDCSKMFYNCLNLTTIPQENIDLMASNTDINSDKCYNGCININCTNNNPNNGLPSIITYSDIPINWK